PTLFIDYPDTARMIQVVSDYVEYHSETRIAEAVGNVEIISTDISSQSGCAILHAGTNDLDLFENPKAQRGSSEISGALILISFENDLIRQIDVLDSAEAEFVEPTDSTETAFDRSTLRGRRIIFDFKYGVLDNILCYGQAYSWYYPSTEGKSEYHQNTVSGDTIRFIVEHEQLKEVDITGGGIGMYLTGKIDEETLLPGDTIEYQGEYIEYSLRDSVITLNEAAHVTDGSVSLDAHLILFDTEKGLIEAFSASVDSISDTGTTVDDYSERFQPGEIPVVLRDGGDEVFGNYLLYSVETEKGRIVQSKSDYEKGRYYGEKLFREQENIFYVCDGRYTTCDADGPHFHFHSSNMKLIEGEKLIAKPVIFYIERIPILALPYYIFPLKSGRHSGFLPFTFGKFQKGERYIRDVGYYWAASEFWDWKGSFDYFEENQNLTFNSRVNFNKRYVLNGYLAGSYLRDTNYDYTTSTESKRNRWVINSAYNHTVSPSFNIRANGRFVSDKTYYSDYSLNSNDRLDRLIKSQVSFSKKFGKNISLSGNVTHTVNLDQESRTDNLPTMSLSLPTIWPFGNGSRDADGKLQQSWY
ncbi:MAG: hypothetical protein KAT85_04440, partial [candidate division Zixibacteria bacterium]|nr:hypothetical protein [candidate division Zixibacteria bacterium]